MAKHGMAKHRGPAPDSGGVSTGRQAGWGSRSAPEEGGGRAGAALGECALIESIAGRGLPFRRTALRVGIGDDCAVLRVRAGEEVVVTTDFSLEGRHFHLRSHPPEAIGHKCLARGLSDIAAMGARPLGAFVSLALPAALTRAGRLSWMERFYDGLLALAARWKVPLAGGDLAQFEKAAADIVLVGAAPRGRALLRSGARAGDLLYVTGRLGGAAAELGRLAPGWKTGRRWGRPLGAGSAAEHPHFYPQPRLSVGAALLRRGLATAAIDISDGLSTDLAHMCAASGVRAEIEAGRLPLWPGATLEQALHGGDDYELLFTARPECEVPRRLGGVPVRRIGRMQRLRRGQARLTLMASGAVSALEAGGWQHF